MIKRFFSSLKLKMNSLDPSKIVAGQYYYAKKGDVYQVTKILAIGPLDPFCLHIRVYKNVFTSAPTIEDIPSLTIMMNVDELKQKNFNFGIGHAPLDAHGFIETNPVLFAVGPVTEEELDDYRYWQHEMGL
jgi:hypothetical protein